MISRLTPSGGPFSYSRILIVGANGAGKTWLANQVAQTCALPVFHNDALALAQKWQYRDSSVIRAAQVMVINQNRWVFEGGPSLARPDVLARCECVLWLDPSTSLRCWRIVFRSLLFTGRTRPEHPAGNIEWPGRRQSRFLVKACRSGPTVRAKLATVLQNIPHQRLRTRSDVRLFLASIKVNDGKVQL